MTGTCRDRAGQLKQLVHALAIASRDNRTPRTAKVRAVIVVACALSPIDLIPDPVLGYLEDLVLIPLGLALAIRLISPGVWADAQAMAAERARVLTGPGRIAAAAIVSIWLPVAAVAVAYVVRWW
jgi:uncharacterized membrane protein YkvA (DUF1232 family)